MAPITSIFLSLLTIISQSTAHFYLNSPPSIGFDDAVESTAPCGSFTVDFTKDNVTSFHIGGDSIAVTSIHPQAIWLFRASLDITASGNWTDLQPTIQQSGLGDYCQTGLVLPATWAGSKGVIQVVQDAPDGILYQVTLLEAILSILQHANTLQCSAVNFVSGSIAPNPNVCKNVTGLSATYSADPALSTLPASGTPTSGSAGATSMSMSMTSGSSTASSTAKASAAIRIMSAGEFGSVMWFVGIGSLALLASLL
jgi:hypothetical protein